MNPLPTLAVHADWGRSPDKRQMACAFLRSDGQYEIKKIEPVSTPGSLLHDLQRTAGIHSSILLGFDFPIGLPIAYAQKCAITDFRAALPSFGKGDWINFYLPAEAPEQISLYRPFYPMHTGSSRQAHLLQTLGLDHIDQLRRQCERAYPGRRAAAPLFWTLGGQQVGKAAIIGWRDILGPASPTLLDLWPFSGPLADRIRPGRVVAAECYPTEYYPVLGINFSKRVRGSISGKRSPTERENASKAILTACQEAGLLLSDEVETQVRHGFGSRPSGEDAFDALVGLLGILFVLRGFLPETCPQDPTTTLIEGWILGQSDRNYHSSK
jgi:hypothetical protein